MTNVNIDHRATRLVRCIRAREARAGRIAKMSAPAQRLLDALYAAQPAGSVTLRADRDGGAIVLHAVLENTNG